MSNKKQITIYILISLLFLTLRFWDIGYDLSNSDAARWHRRSESFLQALKDGDLASTYRHYQPGVSLMWVNAVVKQVTFTTSRAINRSNFTLNNYRAFPVIDGVSKVVNILILYLCLIFALYLIQNLFNHKTAVIFGFIISVEPYMIGIDRWFHLTSFETYFGFLAFLLVLTYLQKDSRKWLIFGSIFLGLSILSKLTSLVLIPFILGLLFIQKKNLKIGLAFVGITLTTCFVLFPALWVDPINVVYKLISAITNAVSDDIRAVEIPQYATYLFYPLMLAFKLSPITLLLVPFVAKNYRLFKQNHKFVILYTLYYLFVLTLSQKKIDRYLLVLIPPVVLLVSNLLVTINKKLFIGVLILYICSTIFLVYNYHPVYSGYYSPLLGGTKSIINMELYDNSGEYFAQAAFYLNQKGRDVNVYVPDNYESFSYYFGGTKLRDFSPKADYVVSSLDIDRKNPVSTMCPILEKAFGPKDFPNVVYAYKCR